MSNQCNHSHNHSASHSHGHSHSHGGGLDAEGRLKVVFWLNFIFAFIELIGGFWTQSLAVTSDALHDFGDSLAIFLSFVLERRSRKENDHRYSYGYRRFSTLAALITGTILLTGTAIIIATSVPRLFHPQQPETTGMLWLAVLGIAVNGGAFLMMAGGSSMNEKMMRWHLLEDLLGWLLVLVGATVMKFFDIPILDPLMAIALSSYIGYNVLKQLRPVVSVFLMGVPVGFQLEPVLQMVKNIDGVEDLHHVHVWSLDGDKHILTGHLVLKAGMAPELVHAIKNKIKAQLVPFQIFEVTLETEFSNETCLDPEHASV